MKRTRRRGAIAALASAGLVLALAACSSGATQTPEGSSSPVAGGVLRLAGSAATASETLDPQGARGANDSTLNSQIYERLLRLDNDFNPIPELATEWKASADATSWTFTLRDGVTFTDGTPFTSKDVVAMIDRTLDPATGSAGLSILSTYLDVGSAVAVDDLTVTFTLKVANAEFPQTLGARQLAIVKAGTAGDERPIGTGPFVVKSFVPGESWELTKNPTYWEAGLPYLDGIRYVNIPDANQLAQPVISGSQDLAGLISATQATTLGGNKNIQLLTDPAAAYLYLVMSPQQKPFDNPKVTEALKLAVDRTAVINAASPGSTPAADALTNPNGQFFPSDVSVPTQNIEKAKSLLAEAGYPNGLDAELAVTEFPAGSTNFATAISEVVAPAGFRLKVQQYDYNTFDSTIYGKAPLYLSYSSARSPLAALSLFSTSDASYSEGMKNQKLDDLVAEAYRTVDDEARAKLTQDALRVMITEGNQLVPAAIPNLWAASTKLHGVELNPQEQLRLKRAYLG